MSWRMRPFRLCRLSVPVTGVGCVQGARDHVQDMKQLQNPGSREARLDGDACLLARLRRPRPGSAPESFPSRASLETTSQPISQQGSHHTLTGGQGAHGLGRTGCRLTFKFKMSSRP